MSDQTTRRTPVPPLASALHHEAVLRAALFESTADCVALLAPDGRLEAVNAAGCAIMRASREQLLVGRAWQDVWDDAGRPAAHAALAQGVGGAVARFRARCLALDGSTHLVDVTLTPLRDDDGRVVRLLQVARDITDVERTRRELAASESRLAAIVESAMDAIVTIDAGQRIVLANRAAEAVFGWSSEELVGRPIDVLLPDALRDRHRAHVARFGAEGPPTRTMGRPRDTGHAALVGRRRDGAVFPIEASISKVDAGGERLYTVILRDVTARHEADAARAAAERALRESEARAWILFRNGPVPMWVFDPETLRIVDVNDAATRRYGWTRDEFLRLTLPDLRPPEEHGRLRASLATSAAGYTKVGRFVHRAKDGECFAVQVARHNAVIDGRAVSIVAAIDVSDAARAEAALRTTQERFELALRATSDVIWDRDLRTHQLTVHGRGLEALGLPAELVDDDWRTWLSIVHPDDREGTRRSMQDALFGPGRAPGWHHEYRVRRTDGTWATVTDAATIVRDDDGTPIRLTGALRDVTLERELVDRLRQAQKMEAVGQLAGGVAHDFNNLLTVIGGNVEMAQQDLAAGADVAPLLDEIALAAQQAAGLVRQLLTFSRRAEVRPRVVSLPVVVRGAERLLRRVIGEEITLDVACAPGEHAVLADPGQLEQVLMNLVVNARDAMLTPRHGHPGRGGCLAVEVATVAVTDALRAAWHGDAPARAVRLRVRDTGHGMDAATQRRIFEPFFTTKEHGRGTGIGLATVFGIATRFGGAVDVTSAPGEGSTFDVLLPLAADAPEAAAAGTPGSAEAERAATVLLVEDEGAVRTAAKRMLERRGHRVVEARHGADALIAWDAQGVGIDVVVTDLRMPELGGTELVAALRARGVQVPVVFMTGYADHALRAEPGPRERMVAKPFDGATLCAAVEELAALVPR